MTESPKSREKAWDEMAKTWRRNEEPVHPIFNEFLKEYGAQLGDKGLDIGCGNGRYLLPFARAGKKMVGVDQAQEMLNGASEVLAKEGLEAELIQGSSETLSLDGASFDFVLSIGAIHHNNWEGIEKSFAQAVSVLKPGGFFFFQGRSINDNARERNQVPDHGYTAIDIDGPKQGVVQHYFTKDELKDLAEKNGLEIVFSTRESFEQTERGTQRARLWVGFQKK